MQPQRAHLMGQCDRWIHLLFPEREIYRNELTTGRSLLLFLVLWVAFSLAGSFLPADGFVGFDWVHFWQRGRVPAFYPPWTSLLIAVLRWPTLIGSTMAATALAVLRRAVHPLSAVAALLALPLAWTVFLGQLEGVVVAGLLALPWLAPLALVKPQVSIFAFGAKRAYLLGCIGFLAASMLIWGPWPLQTLNANAYYGEGRYVQDVSLGLWGAILAIPMLWLSRGDMDMLMAGGAFMTLHLVPYNLLPIVPAIARLKPKSAVIAASLSWLPLASNWVGAWGWWLAWLFVAWLWVGLARQRYGPAASWWGQLRRRTRGGP